jgi:hypothetical protein
METTSTRTTEAPQTGAPAVSDRRRSRRQSFVGNGWLSSEAGTRGRNHQVVVVDLSLHGVGFSSDEQLEPQAVHWLVLDAGGLRASARIRIATCRANPGDNGAFECGAEFF